MKFKRNADGFIKENVTLARTGSMEYLGSEIGIGDANSIHLVYVESDELFHPDTIASAEGIDTTFEHPDKLEITLDDWKSLSVGHVQNIYQDRDFLKGTIFIKDAETIEMIEAQDIKEVSLGYDSDIIEKDGKLVKTNIRANHLAIVPEGRCGSACKIGDSKKVIKPMAVKKRKATIADAIAKMFGGKTSQQKAVARKFGDARKKVADAKTLNDSARKKLADLEEVLANPEATEEEKTAALEAVATVSEDIAQAIEILDGADDSVTEAEAAVEEIPVGDATLPEGVSVPEELQSYVAELEAEATAATERADNAEAEVEELKAEIERLKGAESAATAVADAKARFPKIKVGDAKTVRQVQETVLKAKGVYNDAQLKTLTDCSVSAAYQGLVATTAKPVNNFGKKLIGDANKKAVSAQSRLGGK